MHTLTLHPDCAQGAIRSITADIRATGQGCEAEFRMVGDLDAIVIPPHAPSTRTDFLWKTTCFEIFWQPLGGSYYREFNLSPSSRWAVYDFDDFREGMRDAPVDGMALSTAHASANGEGELVLKASIACELPTPAQVALNAIVEQKDGAMQYWALAFPEGRYEFHSEECRKVRL